MNPRKQFDKKQLTWAICSVLFRITQIA